MTMTGTLPIHSRVKTRQLLLLAHLDQQGSLLHAADRCGMSQPAASKLLRELEDALGVALFERHARGVVPTAYGEILIRHAHAVLIDIRQAQEEVESLKRGERYRVAIGSVMSPASNLLPAAIALLERRHPQLALKIEIDTSRPLVAKLREGHLDIVIGRVLDPDNAADLAFEPIDEEPHSLIARTGHPLFGKGRLGFDDLVDHTWVLPPSDSVLRIRINAMFLLHGLQMPARIVEASWVPMITNLLCRSDALVALPQAVVQPYCEAGILCVLPIDLNVRMDTFGIITRRNHALSADVLEAVAALREAWRGIAGGDPGDGRPTS